MVVQPKRTPARTGSGVKSILLIGETGAGKSTFINIAANYFRNGSVDDVKIMIPTKAYPRVTESDSTSTEFDVSQTSQSQTTGATRYDFTSGGATFSIIDTPGLFDVNGADQDEKNLKIILTAAERCDDLTAIVLIVNGQFPRYNLVSVLSTAFRIYC
jgi:predicted GTPase